MKWDEGDKAVIFGNQKVFYSRGGGCEFERDSISAVKVPSIRKTLKDSSRSEPKNNPRGLPIDFTVVSEVSDAGRLSDWQLENAFKSFVWEIEKKNFENFSLNSDGELLFVFSVDFPVCRTEIDFRERASLYLSRVSAEVDSIRFFDNRVDPPAWEIRLLPPDDWTVGRCSEVSEGLRMLLRYRKANPSAPIGAYTLLMAGKAETLLGQPESDWLEVKRKGYGIAEQSQKHELACDVAAFANSTDGGLLIVGFSTEKDPAGRDILTMIHPPRRGSFNLQTYMQVIANRITPPVEGIRVELVSYRDGDLLVIFIPPQPKEMQPYLVRGASVSGRVSGAYFSIPQRIGSDKSTMSPERVHSMLVAGRSFLQMKGDI
ncbi:helix-turn-helix domain-containing protein [Streptomyces sp. CB02959]|uniref:AlbA family DNA-binding domain-containing protein n=1 Tax=Streptomyces sp. CB02959 TaxID=2020330 RepID=UPI0015E10F71|nr:ATP-binding protein [Streptomyces sp. CB02959]